MACASPQCTPDEVTHVITTCSLLINSSNIGSLPENSPFWTIHIFINASAKAYVTVAYLVSSDIPSSHVILTKMLLAPIEPFTVPRLELMAVLMGVRMAKFINSQLEGLLTKTILWIDSQLVSVWINSAKIQDRFIQNCLIEI